MYNCIKKNLIDYKYFYLKLLFLLGIVLLILNILLIILCYYICKWLYKKIHNKHFLTDCYTNNQKKILKKYENYTVNKIYITKNEVGLLNLNFIKKILDSYIPNSITFIENYKHIFSHFSIIYEFEKNKECKFLLIEKSIIGIRIKPNFYIRENKILKSVKLEKKWKLKDILNNTKKRIGKKKFFNWHISESNCHHWVKEILITLGKFNKKNKKFISQDMYDLNVFPKSKLNILSLFLTIIAYLPHPSDGNIFY